MQVGVGDPGLTPEQIARIGRQNAAAASKAVLRDAAARFAPRDPRVS